MRWVNSLLLLRLTWICLAVVFIRKCCEEFERELTVPIKIPATTLRWKDIDLENPPLINNSLVERLRLNEFLAAAQYRCKESIEIGGEVETFAICKDNGPIERVFVVTGNRLSSGMFEKKLNASRWTVFLPEGSELIQNLEGDVEVHYLTELHRWDKWATWDMEYAVRGRAYDLARMDLYSSHMHSFDQPSVIRQLVQNMTARQLAVTVDIGSSKEEDVTRVTGEWYQLFYWLFFSQSYALIGATSVGMCGYESRSCKYHVSLLKMDTVEARGRLTAPVFGLGSPKEELNRLVNYMKASNCSASADRNFPKFCLKYFNEDANVLLISYHESLEIPSLLIKLKNFYVITPMTSVNSSGLNIRNHGIGPAGISETADGFWSLKTLDSSIKDIYNGSVIDLLLIDMAGGEYALLPQILQLAKEGRFRQLGIRGHLWSEENENFRSLYWNLRQLENYGYSKRYGQLSLPQYDVVYERK